MNKCIILLFIIFILIGYYYYSIENFKQSKNDIYYIEDFFPPNEFEIITKHLKTISRKDLKNEKFRLVSTLNNETINKILYSQRNINKINKIVGKKLFKSDFPIEYRIYPTKSPGMQCHTDTLLYNLPQYEAVLTINNTSDSYTTWYSYNNKKHKIYTKPNSLLLVKAKGNRHCVSPINKGERTIMKYIYTQSDKYNDNYLRELTRFKLFKKA
jgi:hypothetical protein